MGIWREKPYCWTESFKRLIESMDRTSNSLLKKVMRYTAPVIVTNSKAGWVDDSCQRFMPDTLSTLNQHQVKVVSARDMYQDKLPSRDVEWKKLAFLNLTKKIHRSTILNLVVIGDSSAEHEAGRYLKTQFDTCYLKSFKLPRVDPQQMIKNLNIINTKFEQIYRQEKDISIDFSILSY